MVDLSFLKKRSGGQNLQKWQKKLEKLEDKRSTGPKDERFWYPQKDDKGKAQAIIRFLPLSKVDAAVDPEQFPWVKVMYHNFQGPSGQWYNETCLSTIGRPDPVKEDINPLWKGSDTERDIARERKSKTSFISNILVIKDPANPENEGKVFLFKYGVKLHEKITAAMFPEDDIAGTNPIDVTDFWEGANFHLKVKPVAGYPNYDESTFLSPGPIFDGDDDKAIDKIWSEEFSLLEFIDPANLKTYDELKARYEQVLTPKGNISKSAEEVSQKQTAVKTTKAEEVLNTADDDDDDDSLNFLSEDSEDSSEDLDDKLDELFGN